MHHSRAVAMLMEEPLCLMKCTSYLHRTETILIKEQNLKESQCSQKSRSMIREEHAHRRTETILMEDQRLCF